MIGATVDAAMAVLGHLSREWGDHGYRVEVTGTVHGWAIGHVRHSDGSEFFIVSDRYGNIQGHGPTPQAAMASTSNAQMS